MNGMQQSFAVRQRNGEDMGAMPVAELLAQLRLEAK